VSRARDVETPSWRTPTEAVVLILRGATFPTASRIALVVGVVLSLVNQGQVLFGGDATTVTWIRVAVNFLVPYTVASLGYLAPLRRRPTATGSDLSDPIDESRS
jgi:hypothetical protein